MGAVHVEGSCEATSANAASDYAEFGAHVLPLPWFPTQNWLPQGIRPLSFPACRRTTGPLPLCPYSGRHSEVSRRRKVQLNAAMTESPFHPSPRTPTASCLLATAELPSRPRRLDDWPPASERPRIAMATAIVRPDAPALKIWYTFCERATLFANVFPGAKMKGAS